jgi:hypothetical protein
MTKNKNANQKPSRIVTCLFITIENRSATGSGSLIPYATLKWVGSQSTVTGLDAREMFRMLLTDARDAREGVLISNPLPRQTGLHLLKSEEREAGIGTTIVIKRISYI